MKYALSVASVLLLAMSQQQPAFAQANGDLVKQAVAAEGGAELRGLKSLAIKADAKMWEPGQALKGRGEPRFLGDASLDSTCDSAGNRARTVWARRQKYPD